jgi:predicted SprT family Zn-dependent metalloprotease
MADKSQILEVPTPDLIDQEFLRDVFAYHHYLEVRVALDVANRELVKNLVDLGFAVGRSFSKGKTRLQRMKITRFGFVAQLAKDMMQELGLDSSWEFVFDSAKQRAGLCNYSDHKISLSKYIVEYHSIDQSEQVILHEIAHALAGKSAGHGPNWKSVAKSIGYRAEKFTGKEIAEQTAKWVGECRNGHRHYRFKSPKAKLSCLYCGRGFNPRNVISWTKRAA